MKKSELKQLINEVMGEMASATKPKRGMDMGTLYVKLDRLTNDYSNGFFYVEVNGKILPITGMGYKKIPVKYTGNDEIDDELEHNVNIILKTK